MKRRNGPIQPKDLRSDMTFEIPYQENFALNINTMDEKARKIIMNQ